MLSKASLVVALLLLATTAISGESGSKKMQVVIKYRIISSRDGCMTNWGRPGNGPKPYHGAAATNAEGLLKPGTKWNVPGFGTFTVADRVPGYKKPNEPQPRTKVLELYIKNDPGTVSFLEQKYNGRTWTVNRV